MFRTVPLSIIRSFHRTHSNGICRIDLLTACEQDQDVPSWSCSQAVWHIPLLCVQWKTPDDGQRNCPKHAEFYSKNKSEKLAQLVGFIIKIYHDARSPERQILLSYQITSPLLYPMVEQYILLISLTLTYLYVVSSPWAIISKNYALTHRLQWWTGLWFGGVIADLRLVLTVKNL